MASINPCDESVIGEFPQATAVDVRRAVDAACEAFPRWSALTVAERSRYLYALSDALAARAEEIVQLEVLDTGNTRKKVKEDVVKAREQLRFFAGLGYEIKGETIPSTAANLHVTVREPYGVVGRIIPFNHPIGFAASKIAAPLMAGNTVTIKPAEQSCLSVCLLGELCREVLPPGVVNVVTGLGEEAGDALVRDPRVKRIAFTGSKETGMAVQRAAASVGVKHVTLELGGKNPMVVFPDADVGRAAASMVSGLGLAWQGQSCGATSRLFVHRSIASEFLQQIVRHLSGVRIGNPLDDRIDMGPLISREQYERVLGFVASGHQEGARLDYGGKRPDGSAFERGFWILPTVFSDVTQQMRIAREEIFGPVVSVLQWEDEDEMLDEVNSVEYGLTASVWSQRIDVALRAARRIQAGYVWIGGAGGHYRGTPFGGMKASGVGREESLSELLSYTEEKAIHILL